MLTPTSRSPTYLQRPEMGPPSSGFCQTCADAAFAVLVVHSALEHEYSERAIIKVTHFPGLLVGQRLLSAGEAASTIPTG